ncbi:hypothetical protein BCR33DRAFT_720124 [Rhizoclosmatium globosum]|uniref:SH3 domain-containing protein n=1 Tax=Rhizoclosmatium globosum TaxID=329046 RepID=A0A1Y2BX13_9FUNG|nr:hypothetical protein BCR33DRAFT_720124 [Rhizoclosmatium globosum]|eukprot:ORY39286.1 hypothetical protein BCR33DRAFT_720124 [Rhizoclosmatium globosum]
MKKRAIAQFDCVADDAKELSFKKGDVIVNVKPSPSDGPEWFTGRLEKAGTEGLFPGNYVKFVAAIESDAEESDDDPPKLAAKTHSPLAAYSAAFKSTAQSVKEKAIPLVDKAKETVQDRFQQLNKSPIVRKLSQGNAVSAGLTAVALFDCVGDIDSELTFKKGDTLVDVKAAPEEGDDWFVGRIENTTKLGLFPGNYVKFVETPTVAEKPFIPLKPSELKASQQSTIRSEPSPEPKQAPWVNQVSLKPVASTPVTSATNAINPVSSSTNKRTPPPPPPTTSLSAKLANIPGLGPSSLPSSSTPTQTVPQTQQLPLSYARAKAPPPPPSKASITPTLTPKTITSTAQATGTTTPLTPSPQHILLYAQAFDSFAALLNPGAPGPVDELTLTPKQVRTIWLRSRLDNRTLGRVWDLVMGKGVVRGVVGKADFVKGLWLIDLCLGGRELPASV